VRCDCNFYPIMIRFRNKIILLCCINFLISWSCFSQEKERIDFSIYTTEQGRSHNSGNCFAQDKNGFLWIGCNGGLEKFDGYKFTIYKPQSGDPYSLSGIIVWALYVDTSNTLWIGTVGGGLNKYIRDKDRFISYKHTTLDSNSISSDNISCIFEDRSGRLWIGTKGGGINYFDRKEERFISFKRDPSNPNSLRNNIIHDYCIDRSGMVWLGTENGISIFDPETQSFKAYYKKPHDLDIFHEKAIVSLLTTRSGIIWIGTWRKGLFKYDSKHGKLTMYQYKYNDPYSIKGHDMYDIFEDSFGNIWIGTENGLHKYIPGTDNFIHYAADPNNLKSLSDNFIRSIFEDRTGVLWIGTNNGGLNKFDLYRKKFVHYTYQKDSPYTLSNTHVCWIHEDRKGRIWIATRGGLNVFNKKNRRFTCYKHEPANTNSLSNNIVISVTSGKESEVWIGSDGGLDRLNTETETFEHYPYKFGQPNSLSNENVRALYYDKSGVLWIGTWGGGLDKFEPDKNRFTNYPVDPGNVMNNVIITILEDNEGNLWFGTYGKGLVKFNPVTEKYTYYLAEPDDPEKLKDNVVNTVYQDSRGKIWAGTAGGGLSEFDPQEEIFTTYNVEDGLPTSEINGILEDIHGNLWISTGKGISHFNRSERSFTNYAIDDGLQAYVFYSNSCCKTRNGEMYFGGINGFNVFIPDSIKANPYLPRMTISDFQILNKSVKIEEKINGRIILEKPISETEEVILSPEEYIFSIEFAALHFAAPMRNRYAYMMEGFNKEWIETDASKRFISYTTLKPGKYVFKVKGSNNDGRWNPEPVSLRITVLPPYWQTWWFRMVIVIAILLLVIGIHKYRIRIIERRRKELAIQVDERTAELKQSNEELEAFTYSVSHDLRAPLRGMNGFSQILLEDYSEKIDEKGRNYLQRIQKASKRMSHLIDDLLKLFRFTKSEVIFEEINISNLVKSVVDEYRRMKPERKILFKIAKNISAKGDMSLLKVLLRNLIDNAFKFTEVREKARIEFGVMKMKGEPVYFIRDNGIGFELSNQELLFEAFYRQHTGFEGTGIGLAITKRIVLRHSGRIWAEGKANEGSTFYFTLGK
jgi:ligand-binding sensor domain-containing protein/signal transduction histidine kinase